MTFRDGLLAGRQVVLEGQRDSPLVTALTRLGAAVQFVDEDPAPHASALDALVHDSRIGFGSGGERALRRTIERAWSVTHEVATEALLRSGGRLLFVAPSADAGPCASGVRAALENLARTLSVEWARFGVTATALWPGSETPDEQLAELVCFLVSDAGAYFTGCRFEFGVS